jgi:hypothetical protein
VQAPVVQAWFEGPLCCVPVVLRVVRRPVVLRARCGQLDRVLAWFGSRPVVQRVIPNARGSDQGPSCRCGTMPVWSVHAGGTPTVIDRSAEHAPATDRFAREIEGFLTVMMMRSRRLMGKPFGA